MILLTVGIPCRFTEWCEAIFRNLLAAAGTPPTAFIANTLDQLGREVLAAKPACALVIVREANKSFADEIRATSSPIVLTLDTPENAVRALMADYHVPFRDAVRRIGSGLTTILPLMGYEHALVLRATDAPSAFEVAEAIARHCGLDLDEDTIRAAVQAIPEVPASLDDVPLADPVLSEALNVRAGTSGTFGYGPDDAHSLSEIQSAALDPLWAHLNGNPLRDVHWHPALFSLGDKPAEAPVTALDVTGSRRCLMYGPYLRLPEGSWSCSVLLGCAPNAVGVALTLDVFAGVPLNSVEVTITEPGLFEVEMSFVNPSSDAYLEVRMISTKPTFEGEILVGSVQMSPHRAKRLRAVE